MIRLAVVTAALAAFAVGTAVPVLAEQAAINGPAKAVPPRHDYTLYCMGCHQADGSGVKGNVPSLSGFDRHLTNAAGRARLLEIPGVAHPDLSDARLAALLNWALVEFGNAPESVAPFTAKEIAASRR